MRHWPKRRWLAALTGAVVAALVMGIPTGMVRTSYYHRMTPVLWWNYPVWIATAALIGLTLATYVRAGGSTSTQVAGGLLSTFAIGCPICNKLVVSAVGVSGALHLWAPVQPWLALASLAWLGYALHRRLRGEVACPVVASSSALPG